MLCDVAMVIPITGVSEHYYPHSPVTQHFLAHPSQLKEGP